MHKQAICLATFFYIFSANLFSYGQPPIVQSFEPSSGPVGTSVTITGSGFSSTIDGNIVYFGATKALVNSAGSTSLNVTVPMGATHQPISVTTNGLTGFSARPFQVVFPAGGAGINIDKYSFADRIDSPYTPNRYDGGFDYSFNVLIEDVDTDGKPDIISDYNNSVVMLRNNGYKWKPSFEKAVKIPASIRVGSMQVADLDGDGKKDLAFIDSNILTIFRNESTVGTIRFSLNKTFVLPHQGGALSIADLDGDGKPELIASSGPTYPLSVSQISFFKNTSVSGNLTFIESEALYYNNFQYVVTFTVHDVDDDGKPDLTTFLSPYDKTFAVRKNISSPGNISFAGPTNFSSFSSIFQLTYVDIDGDGKDELALSTYDTVSFFKNNSAGGVLAFERVQDIAASEYYNTNKFYIADINGDGKPEIMGEETMAENTSTPGKISFKPFFNFTNYPFGKYFFESRENAAVGDIDGDAKPDLLFVNSYSTSPSPFVNINFKGITIFRNKVNEPLINSFSPLSGKNGVSISIKGKNFTGAFSVNFGGIAAHSFTVVSDSLIQAVPNNGTTGDVSVSTNFGTGTLDGFTYNAPSIVSFSPETGPVGTNVTIIGSGFSANVADNTVFFGSVKATIIAASASQLIVSVPKGASYTPLSVTCNGLTGYALNPFKVTFIGAKANFETQSLSSAATYASGARPRGIVSQDFDSDGKADIAFANYESHSFSILKNTSKKGKITFDPKSDFYTYWGMRDQISVVDFDGDGKSDMIISDSDSNNTRFYRNISVAGTFKFEDTLIRSVRGEQAVTADLNIDGRPDLLMNDRIFVGSGIYQQVISVYQNKSNAGLLSFQPMVNLAIPGYSTSFIVSDINNDGKPDIIVANYEDHTVSIFANTSVGGSFSFAKRFDLFTDTNPTGVQAADFDGDGKVDLAVVNVGSNILSVLKNNSTGTTLAFDQSAYFKTEAAPYSLSIADVDGDSKPDITVTNIGDNLALSGKSISIFKNLSTPGKVLLAEKVSFATGNGPFNVCLSDWDNDGKTDIATSNYSSNTISVFRNQIGEPTKILLCPPSASTSITSAAVGNNYQWQLSSDSGKSFTDVIEGGYYANTKMGTLQLNNIPSSFYGYQYRCMADGNAGDIFSLQFANNWTGAINSTWENPDNWSCGSLPDGNTDVIVSSGNVVIGSNAICRSITLNSGANITVTAGFKLIITH